MPTLANMTDLKEIHPHRRASGLTFCNHLHRPCRKLHASLLAAVFFPAKRESMNKILPEVDPLPKSQDRLPHAAKTWHATCYSSGEGWVASRINDFSIPKSVPQIERLEHLTGGNGHRRSRLYSLFSHGAVGDRTMKWSILMAIATVPIIGGSVLARGYHGHAYPGGGHAYGGSVIASHPHYGWHSPSNQYHGSYSNGWGTSDYRGYSYTPTYGSTQAPYQGSYGASVQSNYGMPTYGWYSR